jgi:hypothetical protein
MMELPGNCWVFEIEMKKVTELSGIFIGFVRYRKKDIVYKINLKN